MHATVVWLRPLPEHFDEKHAEFIPDLKEGDLLRVDVRVVSGDSKQDGPHTLCMLEATFDAIKKKFPHLTICEGLQTDGASNYSMRRGPLTMSRGGVRVKRGASLAAAS